MTACKLPALSGRSWFYLWARRYYRHFKCDAQCDDQGGGAVVCWCQASWMQLELLRPVTASMALPQSVRLRGRPLSQEPGPAGPRARGTICVVRLLLRWSRPSFVD